MYNGKQYNYFYSGYNATWKNERKIEIPIFLEFMKDYCSEDILEVGNVINHYICSPHTVVDMHEPSLGVINQDINQFNPGRKYKLIISVSTFEHIGKAEYGPDNMKEDEAILAVKHCFELLDNGGKFVFSFPMEHHKMLSKYIQNHPELFKITKFWVNKKNEKECWIVEAKS